MDIEAATQQVQAWTAGLKVGVRAEPDADRVVIEAEIEVPKVDVDLSSVGNVPPFTATVDQLIEARAGLLACEVAELPASYRVNLAHPIYVDGLSRHTVMAAAAEMVKAEAAIARLRDGIIAQREFIEQFNAKSRDTLAQIADEARSAEAGAWTATHVVPEGGLAAWASPDPSAQPVANLDARTQLQVQEWQQNWAYVMASNGWTGWVDGQRLVPAP